MTNEARGDQIQRLADKHQAVCQLQIHLGREIEAAGYQMTPAFQSRLAGLIEAEKRARAAYDVAREGWYETICVQPIR
jgi:hypothetical protein